MYSNYDCHHCTPEGVLRPANCTRMLTQPAVIYVPAACGTSDVTFVSHRGKFLQDSGVLNAASFSVNDADSPGARFVLEAIPRTHKTFAQATDNCDANPNGQPECCINFSTAPETYYHIRTYAYRFLADDNVIAASNETDCKESWRYVVS